MKKIWTDISIFLKCKWYVICLSLIVICCYGYTVTHYSVGMDDTAIKLYFEDGLAPYVGRCTLYLINKIIPIVDFSPWLVELLSMLIFMISVTLWCVLFRRIIVHKIDIPAWSYLFVSAIFITCPVICEVYVFYFHNGICIGYGITAVALLFLTDSLMCTISFTRKTCKILLASVFLAIALGCYESFAVVYAIGAIMSFFLVRRLYEKKETNTKYLYKSVFWIAHCCLTGILALVMRGIINNTINSIFELDKFSYNGISYRSILSGLSNNWNDTAMELKRFWIKFYLNAFVYLPVTLLVVSFVIIAIYALYHGIKKKDIFLPLCSIAIMGLPIVMSLIEGIATRYRTAQYIPLVSAFAVILFLIELYRHKKSRPMLWGCYCILSILICFQCIDMIKWFHMDYLKYEDVKKTLNHVAADLENGYDISKPIIFRGAYRVPYEITQDAYCSFSSKKYQWISRISDVVDPHLKEKYYAENGRGYTFAEMPLVSTLQWGVTAFDGTAMQLFRFWEMHDHSFICETDLKKIEEAEKIRNEVNMPGYPNRGYILECEEFIIINLESL